MKTEYKNAINRFVPMTEEQQKDFMFILLDTMDEIAKKAEETKDEKEKEQLIRDFVQYNAMAGFFIDDPDWMKKTPFSAIGYLRDYAKRRRAEFEGNVKKA